MLFKVIIPYLLTYSFQYVRSDLRIDPLVDTKVGLIRGLKASDGDYSMFLGIPYATVNITNPFGPSIPNPEFEDTFEAYHDSSLCPQRNDYVNYPLIMGTLDCLQLNVYVPSAANSRNRLPVMVWIHGGYFQRGYANRYLYGPKYLVKHDVILVTVNYRLGPYGFMCLDTPEVPGNQGLKDQRTALRWIKENIEAFGGDVNQITIFGESAGGAAVDFHLTSKQENLFQKAIMQSGVSLTPGRVIPSDKTKPLKLAEYLGFVTDDFVEALEFLAKVDTHLVIAATLELGVEFKVCVEKDFDDVEIMVSEYPANAIVPSVKKIPVLLGCNEKELLKNHIHEDSEHFKNLNIFREQLSDFFDFGDNLDEIHSMVRNFYVGDKELTVEDKYNVIDFESDFTYNHPIQRAIKKYLEIGAEKIFYYVFYYNGKRNLTKYKANITEAGAAHADELGYLFDISFMTDDPSPEDKAIIDKITTLWTNFAKYGNPTPVTTELLPVTWTQLTKERWHYLKINSELTMESRPFHERMAFWDLFYNVYGKLEKGVSKD